MYNDTKLKLRRRDLRHNSTEAEKILWNLVRNKQLNDLKFFRQYSVGPYVLDLYCPAIRLAIEIDGGHHAEEHVKSADKARENYLNGLEIKVVRFWNNEVVENSEGIYDELLKLITPPPPLASRGE